MPSIETHMAQVTVTQFLATFAERCTVAPVVDEVDYVNHVNVLRLDSFSLPLVCFDDRDTSFVSTIERAIA